MRKKRKITEGHFRSLRKQIFGRELSGGPKLFHFWNPYLRSNFSSREFLKNLFFISIFILSVKKAFQLENKFWHFLTNHQFLSLNIRSCQIYDRFHFACVSKTTNKQWTKSINMSRRWYWEELIIPSKMNPSATHVFLGKDEKNLMNLL